MVKIYCLDVCSTCKKAEKFLKENNVEYERIELRNYSLSREEIEEIKNFSGLPYNKLFNTSGLMYKDLGLAKKLPNMSEEEIIETLTSSGKIVKRPILIVGNKVVLGFREDKYKELLK